MVAILDALAQALKSLFSIRMIWLMIWPALVSLVFWAVLAILFWTPLTGLITQLLSYLHLEAWLTGIKPAWVATGLHALLVVLAFVPLVMFSALLLTSVFAVPVMLKQVGQAHYPALEKRHGGSIAGSLANAFLGTVVYVGLWIVTLPLWLLGPVAAIVPFIAAGYLNQRLFRYDALSEHADSAELKRVVDEDKGQLWGLGIVLGLVQYVPLLNFFAPVYTGLAFVHFCLAKLSLARTKGD
ncbi:MAG TPA: EI24 domain-containing protein [Thiobacillaceae bacterium]|nr:EI24 domain-containing protein [Thiobacillaceae bacterium]